MIRTAHRWQAGSRATELVGLTGEGDAALSPADQLAALVAAAEAALAPDGLSLDDLVYQRLWLRDRALRGEIDGPRAALLGGRRRCASSSFMDRSRLRAGGAVALDLLIQKPAGGERRLVEFDPPRRYAWYLMRDGWQHVSGMAETGDGLEAQFAAAAAAVEDALAAEGRGWAQVTAVRLFLERGEGSEDWLRDNLINRSKIDHQIIDFKYVDGLASAEKHLEIEVTARLK